MTKRTPTIAVEVQVHHLPAETNLPRLSLMTIREILTVVREAGRRAFGDLGSLHCRMDDGTTLAVMNQAAADTNGQLMASQQILRLAPDTGRIVRHYDW